MRTRCGSAFFSIILWLALLGETPTAQQGLTLDAKALFYGDNTEFRNPFREGETLFGAAVRLDAGIEITDRLVLALGVFANQRFGSDNAFERVRPVIAVTIGGRRSRFVVGTLETPRAGQPPGPDRTGPHGLLPPLQRETLAFERSYEAGLQWIFNGNRLTHDSWLQWQRLNTSEHRERLDAGARVAWAARGVLSIPLQAHVVHEGGQLFASGRVRDSFALASGVIVSNRAPPDSGSISDSRILSPLQVSLELMGGWSRYTPDREAPDPTRDGAAFFGRLDLSRLGWRGHVIMWRGDDFIKDEGDPNYMSIRRDGTRYRGVRDYAETGVTRTFPLGPGTLVETSVRIHRIERRYEYSYRVLAVVGARARVK